MRVLITTIISLLLSSIAPGQVKLLKDFDSPSRTPSPVIYGGVVDGQLIVTGGSLADEVLPLSGLPLAGGQMYTIGDVNGYYIGTVNGRVVFESEGLIWSVSSSGDDIEKVGDIGDHEYPYWDSTEYTKDGNLYFVARETTEELYVIPRLFQTDGSTGSLNRVVDYFGESDTIERVEEFLGRVGDRYFWQVETIWGRYNLISTTGLDFNVTLIQETHSPGFNVVAKPFGDNLALVGYLTGGGGLWLLDGSPAGITLVDSTASPWYRKLEVINDKLYYMANDQNRELVAYSEDGTREVIANELGPAAWYEQ